jgi:hypothetical protein
VFPPPVLVLLLDPRSGIDKNQNLEKSGFSRIKKKDVRSNKKMRNKI